MRIAFYAPLKPPDHPVPSGDRRIGRELLRALELAGHEAIVASRWRSWDGAGDAGRQAWIERLGGDLAQGLIRRHRQPGARRPDLWLTYHLYHKAPDWLGPRVAAALSIPYVVVEASHAPKQVQGPWARGHVAARDAIARAAALIGLNGDDRAGLEAIAASQDRIFALPPFIDTTPYVAAAPIRAELARRHDLDPRPPWLLTVGMMRRGAKLDSYRALAKALERLVDLDWRVLIIGDGPARGAVEAAFADLPSERYRLLGQLPATLLPEHYASADLYVWPAIHEAFGMALLEAQAAGLPVVAGRERGVPDIVRDGETGILVEGGTATLAAALRSLLRDRSRRLEMSRRARTIASAEHDIAVAARRLDGILANVVADFRP